MNFDKESKSRIFFFFFGGGGGGGGGGRKTGGGRGGGHFMQSYLKIRKDYLQRIVKYHKNSKYM